MGMLVPVPVPVSFGKFMFCNCLSVVSSIILWLGKVLGYSSPQFRQLP